MPIQITSSENIIVLPIVLALYFGEPTCYEAIAVGGTEVNTSSLSKHTIATNIPKLHW